MKKAYRSLKSTLTLNFVIVAVLPAVVVGLIALKILSDSMENEITVKNEILAKSLAAEVDRFLQQSLLVLQGIKKITEKSEIDIPNSNNVPTVSETALLSLFIFSISPTIIIISYSK